MKCCSFITYIIILISVINISCTKPGQDIVAVALTAPDSIQFPVQVPGRVVKSTIIGYMMANQATPYPSGYTWLGAQGTQYPFYSSLEGYFHLESDSLNEDATILKDDGAFQDVVFPFSYPILIQKNRIQYIRKLLISSDVIFTSNQPTSNIETGVTIGNISLKSDVNSWVNEGNPYAGNLQIQTMLLNNNTPDLADIQPGDMRGVNKKGEKVYLHPYLMTGFMATPMYYTPAKVAPGKKINLHVPIAMEAATAEATTWLYDRDKGLWIELDTAVKSGLYYDFSVPQTGVFAVGYSTPMVYLHAKMVDKQGAILPYAQFIITPQDKTSWPATVFTDNEGEFTTYVPAGENLTIRSLNAGSIMMGPLTANTWTIQKM